ncbi:MAG: hypothetical protein HZC44_13020 [Geobacter sp.]|nr:hypothetical protein [Geobacter sp.]
MRSFTQRQEPTPKATTGISTNQHEVLTGQLPAVSSILQLQRTIGNRAVQRLLQTRTNTGSTSGASARFGPDFSRIPAHPEAPKDTQSKQTVSSPGDVYEQEATGVADSVMRMPDHAVLNPSSGCSDRPDTRRAPVSGLVQREGGATHEELMLAEQRSDYHRLVTNWYTRYMLNLETNARNARNANQRLIEFEEGSIGQLRTAGAVGQGIAYLFGTPGAVAALCVIVLTEVAAQGLSSRSAKIAGAAARLDGRLANARTEVTRRRELIDNRIDATDTLDWGVWLRIASEIDRAGVPQVVPENIIYRDLLFAFARGGGYNISGSQWNVENMSPFGRSPWYHSWDWGSPGWTNGQDIAEELNALAAGDPSTRTRVSINPR